MGRRRAESLLRDEGPRVSAEGEPSPHGSTSATLQSVSDEIKAWASEGRRIDVEGRPIFVWERGAGRPLLALHGFPSSSRDWWRVAGLVPGRRFIALDFPGFGLSDKDPLHDYSLFTYADVVEEVARRLGITDCDLLAHDMGDTVAAELLARANGESLDLRIERCVLLNGSIFIERAHLTPGQRLFLWMQPRKLRVPVPVRLFRPQLKRTFGIPPSPELLGEMERLLVHEGGARMLPVTIRYIEERRRNQDRWTQALLDYPGELAAMWGELDPVAVPDMVDRLVGLRPSTQVTRWPDVGHWPNIEVPGRLADELGRFLQ